MLSSLNENPARERNPMAKPLYLYLFRSEFLVSFTNPSQKSHNVKSVFKSLGY